MTDEKIKNVAAALEKPIGELARDIWTLAEYLESKGNKQGMHTYILESIAKSEGTDIPTYFLKIEYEAAYQGILFESSEGYGRKRESNGWMVRKRPHWKVTWAERFGEIDPALRDEAEKAEAARVAAEEEAKKARRERERFCQGEFETFSTIQIAYRAAVMDVLYQRYEMRYRQQKTWEWKDSPTGYIHNIFRQQWWEMVNELIFRVKGSPDPKRYRSKKALRAATADFEKANDFVKAVATPWGMEQYNTDGITDHFFTPEFVEMAVHMDGDPDLRVDFENLPKRPPAKTPVRHMTDREVVTDFLKFVAETDDVDSFEYEDKKLILATLRKMFARAKGQHASDETVKIGKGEE